MGTGTDAIPLVRLIRTTRISTIHAKLIPQAKLCIFGQQRPEADKPLSGRVCQSFLAQWF